MKINQYYTRNNEKPIKYKQFIQELHNSSRSSNNDQSMLSQRSFRQSNTIRDNRQWTQKQSHHKKHTQVNKNSQELQNNAYKITKPKPERIKQAKSKQKQWPLYTFCDAKNTQKSVQIHSQTIANQKSQSQNLKENLTSEKRYFKTKKTKNEQKQNISFVNKIIEKVEAGFQGKILKTETELPQNMQSRKNSVEKTKLHSNKTAKMTQSITNSNNDSSHRKIQGIKKIFILSNPSNNRTSNKKRSINKSEEKSRQPSLNRQNQTESKPTGLASQQCSSKKKIISLNINPLKVVSNPINKVRLKLSLDKSYQSRSSFLQHRASKTSLQKMPSLQHSKIQSLHNEFSNQNLLSSGIELKQLTGHLSKQKNQRQEQNYKLHRIIDEQRQKQKRLRIQNTQLSERLKESFKLDERKQLQILRKDCTRLTNSYKQIKKLYEMTTNQKQELEAQLQNILNQNQDLKECLKFKKQQCTQLECRITELQHHMYQLQEQLTRNKFPSQLTGLSQIIKQKVAQYDGQIASLASENEKLILIRQKLQNYNITLKQQIEEKDNLIWELQQQQKESSQMRRSCRDEVLDYRQNQSRLHKIVKQIQSKLKLANIHNQYLTKQILCLKSQRKIASPSSGSSPMLIKFNSANTLANTITTRNSSISFFKQKLDPFINNQMTQGQKQRIVE